MDVLLLAAGLGKRLREKTRELPKALVEVNGRPLLQYALDSFGSRPWVRRIVVVTGFGREKVLRHLEGRERIVETFNPEFEKGNFYSLLKGLEHAGEEWLVTNVDHIFPAALIEKCRAPARGVSAVCDFDRDLTPDCMKVELAEPKAARRIARIHKQLTRHDCGYIGMTFVRAEGHKAYLDAVERIAAREDPKAYAEMVLQELASGAGAEAPHVVDASGFGWLEVDTSEDLMAAESALREHPEFLERGRREI